MVRDAEADAALVMRGIAMAIVVILECASCAGCTRQWPQKRAWETTDETGTQEEVWGNITFPMSAIWASARQEPVTEYQARQEKPLLVEEVTRPQATQHSPTCARATQTTKIERVRWHDDWLEQQQEGAK